MSKKHWINLKRGLITDPKHRQAMGEAVWLYLHILDRADFETGIVPNWKDEAEAEEMNLPIQTLRHQRRKLELAGYITSKKAQHDQEIIVHKYVNPRSYSGKVLNPKGERQSDKKQSLSNSNQSDNSLSLSKIQSDNQSDNQGDNLLSPLSIISNHVPNTGDSDESPGSHRQPENNSAPSQKAPPTAQQVEAWQKRDKLVARLKKDCADAIPDLKKQRHWALWLVQRFSVEDCLKEYESQKLDGWREQIDWATVAKTIGQKKGRREAKTGKAGARPMVV